MATVFSGGDIPNVPTGNFRLRDKAILRLAQRVTRPLKVDWSTLAWMPDAQSPLASDVASLVFQPYVSGSGIVRSVARLEVFVGWCWPAMEQALDDWGQFHVGPPSARVVFPAMTDRQASDALADEINVFINDAERIERAEPHAFARSFAAQWMNVMIR